MATLPNIVAPIGIGRRQKCLKVEPLRASLGERVFSLQPLKNAAFLLTAQD